MSRHRCETQEQVIARRDRQRARYAAMSPEQKRDYARRKNGRRNMPQMVIEPSRFTKPEPVRVERESIDSFIARGGRIDLLPPPWESQHQPQGTNP